MVLDDTLEVALVRQLSCIVASDPLIHRALMIDQFSSIWLLDQFQVLVVTDTIVVVFTLSNA